MPQFAVKVFGVIAFDALARAEAHVDRTPGCEEGRQRSHISGRRAAAAEARREARISSRIEQARGADRVELGGDQIERFIPRHAHKAWIFATALFRVGPLHRIKNAIRMISLLYQPKRLDADLAA